MIGRWPSATTRTLSSLSLGHLKVKDTDDVPKKEEDERRVVALEGQSEGPEVG